MDWQRIVSGVVALSYLTAALVGAWGQRPGEFVFTVLFMAGFLCIPLAMIWFGGEWGGSIVHGQYSQPEFKRLTPPSLIVLCGWLLLLLPVIVALAAYVFTRLS
ncbi:MAG TPA: hypothetical protein VK421_20035 [Pyrinomonadaceae bacterium]|nr:hypothetical protein [Pyrinomonadaceae bacterium]